MSDEKAAKLSEAISEALAVDGELPMFVLLWVPDDGNYTPETISNITTPDGTRQFLLGTAEYMDGSTEKTRGVYEPKGLKKK